mgnify:FL=1
MAVAWVCLREGSLAVLPPSICRAVGGWRRPELFTLGLSAGGQRPPPSDSLGFPSPSLPTAPAPSCPAAHAQIHPGMAIAIDLDEPHLKRDATLGDPSVPRKIGSNKEIKEVI